MATTLGYADLTPPQVLAALDAVGLVGDGRILQLNSYENRVFLVYLDDGRAVVAKFYRPGRWSDAQIVEEHAFGLELAAAEVPVVAPLVLHAAGRDAPVRLHGSPPTLAACGGHRFMVAPRCAGREPELDEPGTLERIGRFIGRLHEVGRRRPFRLRRRIDVGADGERALALLEGGLHVAVDARAAWTDAAQRALALAARAYAAVAPRTLRLHGDCHIGNVLWSRDDGGPQLVDLDDACQGPAVQDLWMLASGDAQAQERQFARLLAGYRDFADFDDRELALVEPLRTLRMIRHSAWLAERWHDPAFPAAFPYFDTAAYWSQQTVQLREQIELMGAAR
jgi:Ser/Thr protein kinase RdoA (MazF antagonist)